METKMSEEITIGRRYTLVIPKSIREEIGLQEGQRALICLEGGKIVIEPFPSDPFKILDEIVREPYDEAKEEKRVERWMKKHAGR
jgi:AbrB family looped-hinge helix DNA binding protein